jgi:hypothetical protein
VSDLVELETFGTSVEANLARLYLESEGIEAVLFDTGINSVGGGWLALPVRLMVLDRDFQRARKLVGEYLKANEKSGAGRNPPSSGSR